MTAPVKALTAMPVSTRVTTSVRPPSRDAVVHEQHGDEPADERERRDRPRPEEVHVRGDLERGAERGAGRHADEAGLGERVRERALHRRAGAAERAADEHREDHPREADLPEHLVADGVGRVRRRGCRACRPREARTSPSGTWYAPMPAARSGGQRRGRRRSAGSRTAGAPAGRDTPTPTSARRRRSPVELVDHPRGARRACGSRSCRAARPPR